MYLKDIPQDPLLIHREEFRKLFSPAKTRMTMYNWQKRGLLVPITIRGNVFYERKGALELVGNMIKYGSQPKKP